LNFRPTQPANCTLGRSTHRVTTSANSTEATTETAAAEPAATAYDIPSRCRRSNNHAPNEHSTGMCVA
jgi:hypothetical protein